MKQNDMVLLHVHDSHFNLVISKDSDLASGSLSYRFNVGPLMKENIDETNNDEVDIETNQVDKQDDVVIDDEKEHNSNSVDFNKELRKCQDTIKNIKLEYSKCENRLRIKTEESEKLKTELKDLKELMELEKQSKEMLSNK